jgi:hypothetical protein
MRLAADLLKIDLFDGTGVICRLVPILITFGHKMSSISSSPSFASMHVRTSSLEDFPFNRHSTSLHSFVGRALNVLSEHDVPPPDEVHLEIVVIAALEARSLFFAAATETPTNSLLATFFDGFVLNCVGRSTDGRPFQESWFDAPSVSKTVVVDVIDGNLNQVANIAKVCIS